jgi:FKBP-type peptidyl-prolyl cis-trans isomerase FklB
MELVCVLKNIIITGEKMKYTKYLIILLIIFGVYACQNQQKEVSKSDMKDFPDSVSYSIGYDIGNNLKTQDIEIKNRMIMQGIFDGMKDSVMLLDANERQQILSRFQQQMMSKRTEDADKNKAKGEDFLAENKQKEGVKVSDSGLQYKVVEEGTGKSPSKGDKVKVHYKGTLIDGTVFDSSYDRGQPLEIGVGRVIPGWTEALQKMKVGAKWKLFIPSDLAYGEQGAGNIIGPNETLIFEVELLDIVE